MSCSLCGNKPSWCECTQADYAAQEAADDLASLEAKVARALVLLEALTSAIEAREREAFEAGQAVRVGLDGFTQIWGTFDEWKASKR
ncbi:hypothetical protein EP7_004317 [Isosphaeraceae bacterium EP7]